MQIQKPYLFMWMTLVLMVSQAAWASEASLSDRKAQNPKVPVYTTEKLKSPVSRDPAWTRPPSLEELRRQAPFVQDRSTLGPVQIVKPTDGHLKKAAPAFKGSSL